MSLTDAQKEFVESWVSSCRYNPYRNYPGVSKEEVKRVLRDTLMSEGERIHLYWYGPEDAPRGLMRVTDLDWDSEIYGMKMGQLTHLCGEVTDGDVQSRLGADGYSHISTRIDVSDFRLEQKLIQEGFFQVGALLTYIWPRELDPIEEKRCPASKDPFVVRMYEEKDRETILEITRKMFSNYLSRYYRDPLLREGSGKRYEVWAKKYMDGEADVILVAELEGEVKAFLGYRTDRQLLESTGFRSFGTGLGASTLERRGAYGQILYESLSHGATVGVHFGVFDIHIDNFASQHLFQELELKYIRAQYDFHCHIGDPR